MQQPILLVTGANGQLGKEIFRLHNSFAAFRFVFAGKAELDIVVESWVHKFIEDLRPTVVINCAAYTNVERAEEEIELAMQTNGDAPGFLAAACKKAGALLIHVSTDYVFDGQKKIPYTESDSVNPLNVYGESKLLGERKVDEKTDRYVTIRTSWLYSAYGHNFFKTMIRLAKEKGELNVVNDQTASPTYAGALAADILKLVDRIVLQETTINYGIYHYAHDGECTWYDFAVEIMRQMGMNIPVKPVMGHEFPVKAIRPMYSKLETTLWKKESGLAAIDWKKGLEECIKQYQRETH